MVQVGIATIALVMAVVVVWGIFRISRTAALVAALLLPVEWLLAESGLLRGWAKTPPPFFLMMAGLFILTLWLAFSRTGEVLAKQTPLCWLIGLQAFRLPLELVMHQAAVEGIMPVQMSYSGSNFDILTGASAIVAAILVWRGIQPRLMAWIWNVLGFVLLLNVVQIAVRSTPMIQAYGPDRLNTWVADPPYVWLPGILVQIALLGHILVFRKLLASRV